VRSGPAEPAPSPACRAARPSRAGGFLLVLTLVTALVLGGCSSHEDTTSPPPSGATVAPHDVAARAVLDRLVRALEQRSVDGARAVAAPGARDLLGAVADNADALRLGEVSMRYVDEAGPLPASARSEYGADAWAGTVELRYAFGGVDRKPSQVQTRVVFVPDGDRARIAGFGGPGARTPLWLVDRLAVVRRGATVTAVAAATAGRYPGLVTRAVAQVRRTLPGWRGPLVVEVPRSQEQLDAALEAGPGEYDDIAAVTTTEDGSVERGAGVRVFVNPHVFTGLEQRGAEVVMSHETTHVATGATFARMPTWLLEGFADYVALRDAGVPVSVAAGQILRRIRSDGLPDGLPTSTDLDPTAAGLGATYEEAWLACRFLGRQYGATRLVAFYRAVSDGATTRVAFRRVLGTTERAFVARWRTDLADLADLAGVAGVAG
jgi:hypothetical protein